MYFTSVILLSSLLLVFSFLLNFIPISSHLNVCPNNKTVIYNNNNELNKCYALQLNLAKQRHIIRLIKRDQFTMNLQLACHLCSNDNPIHFQWYRILRKKYNQTIFHLNNKTFYDHKWILNRDLLEPVLTNTLINDPCLINRTNELVYKKFDPYHDSGTYVCQSLNNNKHPLNFIWYHIDYINAYTNTWSRLNLPFIERMNKSVTTYNQLIQLQKYIEEEMNRPEYFHDQTFSLLRITSKSFHNLTHYKYCGNIHVQQNRVCYVQIPRKLPIHIDNSNNNIEEIKLIYFILFNGFYELGQFYDDDDDNNTNQLNFRRLFKKSSENLATQLGFQLFLNKTYLYIPCQYNFFKQLPNLNETFQPLNILNLYVTITYHLHCVHQLDTIEMMNLPLKYDVTKMKLNIHDYHHVNYMKLEKLAMEYEPFITLDCYLTKEYICNHTTATNNNNNNLIKWSTTNLTFYSPTIFNERIYINEKCQLIIHNVKLIDSNIYNCYIKNQYQSNNPWQLKISYRLRIEKSYYQWPSKNNLLIGLLFLVIYSMFIIIIWFVLMIYNVYIFKQLAVRL
ncbi:unnamed protein product [Schistosoma curassoni]|uniref:Ig-like domain-containing protein n=1 Tax=Schistosoma curassoni TaxID=6186 RepID=A0A183JJE9_9TREM|nr:unnamed protein product [Schistosoma curassoni]